MLQTSCMVLHTGKSNYEAIQRQNEPDDHSIAVNVIILSSDAFLGVSAAGACKDQRVPELAQHIEDSGSASLEGISKHSVRFSKAADVLVLTDYGVRSAGPTPQPRRSGEAPGERVASKSLPR